MALLPVLTYPDPFLKRIAEDVTDFNDALVELLHDMAETMYEAPGIGLAATQVGSKLNAFVMDVNFNVDDPDSSINPIFLINPKIVEASGHTVMEEGCLSVPEYRAEVTRAMQIRVEYQNERGETQTLTTDGLEAVCVQHEMDHLKGILFIDHLTPLRRKMIQNRLKKHARG